MAPPPCLVQLSDRAGSGLTLALLAGVVIGVQVWAAALDLHAAVLEGLGAVGAGLEVAVCLSVESGAQ